ncbi:5' nucleotidase [Gordonia phage DatBoi]|nr:5' nucleotidase [Gordonia phage DatBoi]
MARVMIDLDGVLFDFADALRDSLIDIGFNVRDLPAPTKWAFFEEWGLTLKGFEMVYNRAVRHGALFSHRAADRADIAALHQIHRGGHTIHIVTARGMGPLKALAHEQTAEWLRTNQIPYDTLTFAEDKTIIQTDFALEDNRDNYDALVAAGTRAYLYDQPYNQDAPGCSRKALRVGSVSEFAHEIAPEDIPF